LTGATHKVARGETLYSIARRYGTTVESLRAANGLSEHASIAPGRKLVIPRSGAGSSGAPVKVASAKAASGSLAKAASTKGAASSPMAAAASSVKASGTSRRGGAAARARTTYRVRKGDTLSRIASAHGSTIEDLCRWNDLNLSSPLPVGTTLVLYR